VGDKIAHTIVEDRDDNNDNNKRKYIDDDDLCKQIKKFPRISLGCIEY